MSSFFYVVNQSTGKVLDSYRNFQNVQLNVFDRNGSNSQLWKWDSEARLVNKHGFVAEIVNGSKDVETPIVLNTPVDDNLGQKWRLEEDAIKSGLSELVMGCFRIMDHNEGIFRQFISEVGVCSRRLLKEYKIMLSGKNPLTEATFWKDVVENYSNVIIGCSIDEYENEVKQAIEILNIYAVKLEEVNKGTGITHATGGAASIIGGGTGYWWTATGTIYCRSQFGSHHWWSCCWNWRRCCDFDIFSCQQWIQPE